MKFPDSIKIGAKTYELVVDQKNQRLHEHCNEFGHIDYDMRVISISTKFPNEQKLDSLVHEVVHGIGRHMELDTEWGEKTENYVSRIANGLNMVLRDNPELLKMLMKEMK